MKALLVIDLQKGTVEQYAGDLLARINRRIALAAENRELILYIKNVKRLRSGASTAALAAGLLIRSEHILCKEGASAFSCEEVPALLRERQIAQVELVGVDGNSCIAASAAHARRLGFAVLLPCGCIGVRNEKRFDETRRALEEKGVVFV